MIEGPVVSLHMHFCKIPEGGAVGYDAPTEAKEKMSLRDSILSLWDIVQMGKRFRLGFQKIRDLECLCYYALEVWSRRPKMPIDVDKMVEQWKAVIIVLCTAHTKDEVDKAEFQMDELLTPILKAPVKQLREFYNALRTALKADERIPFFVWSIFNAWGKAVVDDAKDDTKVKHLKKKLASEIADMVEPDIKEDITAAVVGALMWRDPGKLEEIKEDLKQGAKPRLRGRESCLFLVTQRKGGAEHTVML